MTLDHHHAPNGSNCLPAMDPTSDAYLNFTSGSNATRLSGCANAMLVPARRAPAGTPRAGEYSYELAPEAGLRHLVQRYPFATKATDCLNPRRASRSGDDPAQLRARLHVNYLLTRA